MEKETRFNWGWQDYPLQPDPMMTRKRAAVLLRAWRRVSRQPANHKPIDSIYRVAPHIYRVESSYYAQSSTLQIVRV